MKRLLVLACMLAPFVADTASAQIAVQRTFVSTTGNDANTNSSCSSAAPCRSFIAALKVTRPGGEIVPLTSGGYGPVTITQSVQIAVPLGVYAAITTTSLGDGIRVSASATDTVVIRGLTLNGLASGQNGVNATSFGTLHIENCAITGFIASGIVVNTTGNANASINDTVVRNNGATGASFKATNSRLNVSIDGSRFEGNGAEGVLVTDGTVVSATRTVSTQNGSRGFSVFPVAQAASASLACDGCTSTNNGNNAPEVNNSVGFLTAGQFASIQIARSTASGQVIGFANVQGTFESLTGTNLVRNNGQNTNGTITPVTSP